MPELFHLGVEQSTPGSAPPEEESKVSQSCEPGRVLKGHHGSLDLEVQKLVSSFSLSYWR